jgi:hypothetical protein
MDEREWAKKVADALSRRVARRDERWSRSGHMASPQRKRPINGEVVAALSRR